MPEMLGRGTFARHKGYALIIHRFQDFNIMAVAVRAFQSVKRCFLIDDEISIAIAAVRHTNPAALPSGAAIFQFQSAPVPS